MFTGLSVQSQAGTTVSKYQLSKYITVCSWLLLILPPLILSRVEMQYSVLSQTAQTVASKNLDISCDFFTGSTPDWTVSSVCS